MPDVARAIAALTFEQTFREGVDVSGSEPLLAKSIAMELRELDKVFCRVSARGSSRLFAIAEAIDEALLALAED